MAGGFFCPNRKKVRLSITIGEKCGFQSEINDPVTFFRPGCIQSQRNKSGADAFCGYLLFGFNYINRPDCFIMLLAHEHDSGKGMPTMFCPNCGTELKEGYAFCTKCGSPVQPAGAPNPSVAPRPFAASRPAGAPKKKHTALLIAIIAVVSVAVLVCVLLFVFDHVLSNTPKGVAEKYMKALARGDVDAIDELRYPGTKDDGDDSDFFADEIREIIEEGGRFTYSIHEYDELSEYEMEGIRYEAGYHNFDADRIQEADIFYYSYTIRGSGSHEPGMLYLIVLKIENKWYFYGMEC